MITHYLTRGAARGNGNYWSITQDDSITYIEAGQIGRKGREFPPVSHGSGDEARHFVNRQLTQKNRQGYRKGRQPALKRTVEFEDDEPMPQKRQAREFPIIYDGEFDDDDTSPGPTEYLSAGPSGGIKRREPKQHVYGGKRSKRSMEEELLMANARADAIRLGVTPPSDDEGDTDSVGSSSVGSYQAHRRGLAGVSPLNRRRSMRLALRRGGSDMDMTEGLSRQNTMEMASPPPITRMDTDKRWESWRPRRQATSSMLKSGPPSLNKMDTLAPDTGPVVKKGRLFKRVSTTTFLREALEHTNIEEPLIVPKVFENAEPKPAPAAPNHLSVPPQVLPRLNSPQVLPRLNSPQVLPKLNSPQVLPKLNSKKSMRRLGKKNTVLVMPSVDEVDGSGRSEAEHPTPEVSSLQMRGPTASTAPRPRRAASIMKRTSSLVKEEVGAPSSKRARRAPLARSQSISAATRHITLPPRDIWPVRIAAQVMWRVPLTLPGLVGRGRAVCVEAHRCLVGDDTGKVIVIDETVSVKHILQLAAPVSDINLDGQFVYAICDNGQIYDVSVAEPRVVFELKDKDKGCCLDFYDGVLVVCDSQGYVTRYNHDHQVAWRAKCEGDRGLAVKVDDTGVYCCTSVGVTKYSLEDGTLVWDTPLRDSARHAVQFGGHLFVTCGPNVLKMNKASGDVGHTFKYPKQGKGSPAPLRGLAVGGGLVFAGGQNIVCFEERSGAVVFVLTPPVSPYRYLHYFEGRIFCVGDESVSAVEFAPDVIEKARSGQCLVPVDVMPTPQSPVKAPLRRLPTVPSQRGTPGVVIECTRPEPRKGKLKVCAISRGFSKELDVQFPPSLFVLGSKFIVNDLKRSETGQFYRVFGDIKELAS